MGKLDDILAATEPIVRIGAPPQTAQSRLQGILNQVEPPKIDPATIRKNPDKRYTIRDVLDGDTVDVEGVGRVRILGLNAPEIEHALYGKKGEPGGEEAKAYARSMLAGRKVRLEMGKEDYDSYGRLLARLYFEKEWAGEMVSSGRARSFGPGPAPEPTPLQTAPPTPGASVPQVRVGGVVPPPPAKQGDVATAIVRSASVGVLKGIYSPIGWFMPETFRRLKVWEEQDRATLQGYLNSDQAVRALSGPWGAPNETTKRFLEAAPGIVGELAGFAVPAGPILKGARVVSKTAGKVSKILRNPVVKQALQTTTGATGFAAFSHLEDGESRSAALGSALLTFGMIDFGAQAFSHALRRELGPSYTKVVKKVQERTGASTADAEQRLALVRADPGLAAKDVQVAGAIDEVAKTEPIVATSKLNINAQQIHQTNYFKLLPDSFVVDEALGKSNPNFGVRFTFNVEGEPPQTMTIGSVAGSAPGTTAFSGQLDLIRQRAIDAAMQGKSFSFTDVTVAHKGTASRFLNFLKGRHADGTATNPPAPWPGAAPRNTVSETGGIPKLGEKIRFRRDDGSFGEGIVAPLDAESTKRNLLEAQEAYRQQALDLKLSYSEFAKGYKERFGIEPKTMGRPTTAWSQRRQAEEEVMRSTRTEDRTEEGQPPVLGPREPVPGAIWVHEPDGQLTMVKLANITVALPKPGERVNIAPHSNGTPRRGLINTETKNPDQQLFIEPMDLDLSPTQNSFRSYLFSLNDTDAEYGHLPRVFFGPKGVQLSIPPGERVWETAPWGRDGDFGPRDSIQYSTRRVEGAEHKSWPRVTSKGKPGAEVYWGDPTDVGTAAGGIGTWEERVRVEGGKRIPIWARKTGYSSEWSNAAAEGPHGESPFPGMNKRRAYERQLKFGPQEVGVESRRPHQGTKASEALVVKRVEPYTEFNAPRTTNQPPVFPAGMVPRRFQPEWWTKGPYGELYKVRNAREVVEEQKLLMERPPEEPVESPLIGATGRLLRGNARSAGSRPLNLTGYADEPMDAVEAAGSAYTTRQRRTPWPEEPWEAPPDYALTLDMKGHPEMATAQKAARILIAKGVDPDMPVDVFNAYNKHTERTFVGPHTLREWADREPWFQDWTRMQDEASMRGLKIYPEGKGILMRAEDGAWEKHFATQEEAAEYIVRRPGPGTARKIEDKVEAELGIGSSRSFDPDVDANTFRPAALQELSSQELFKGTRPLIVVYSSKPHMVLQAVRAMESLHGLKPGTISALEVAGMAEPGRSAVALFDPNLVQRVVTEPIVRQWLSKLGVQAGRDVNSTISQLGAVPHALAALYGRDPVQALYYAWLRKKGLWEAWNRGKLLEDTMGKYRVFDPVDMQLMQRGGPGSMFAGGEPPDHVNMNLRDVVPAPIPEGERFQSPGDPPQFEPSVEAEDWHTKLTLAHENTGFQSELRKISGKRLAAGAGIGAAAGAYAGDTPEEKLGYGTMGALAGVGAVVLGQGAGRFFRIPEELMKEWEKSTGVPFWSRMYRRIEDTRDQMEGAFAPVHGNINELFRRVPDAVAKEATLAFEAIAQGKDISAFKFASDKSAPLGRVTYDFMKKWLMNQGAAEKDVVEFLADLPALRKADGNYIQYANTRIDRPRLMTLMSKQFTRGDVALSAREMNLRTNMMRISRAWLNQMYMEPTFKETFNLLKAYELSGRVTQDQIMYFHKYMSQVAHMPDHLAIALQRTVHNAIESLSAMEVMGKHPFKKLEALDSKDFVSMLMGSNYMANMAWQPGLVLRNALQTLQTGSSVGMKYWRKGMKEALRWYREEPGFEESLVQRGILTRDLLTQQWSDVKEFAEKLAELESTGGKVTGKYIRFMEKGQSYYKHVDDANRIIAFTAQYERAMEHAVPYTQGKIDWNTFLRRSMADMRDVENGPLLRMVKELLDEGNPEAASHALGIDFMRATQFVYRRGTVPYWMMSTWGRLLGQYGTWPAYFAELGLNSFKRGSMENKLKVLGRWSATNATMYYAAKDMFGVDASRWLFFSPLGYTGGPFAQIGQQSIAALNQTLTGDQDPVSKIQKGRLARAWMQFTPAPVGATRKTIDGFQAISDGDWTQGFKKFLGFPEIQ